MGDRDRQHVKLADDLIEGTIGPMFAIAEFDDEDEQVVRDLTAVDGGIIAAVLRLEKPDGTRVDIATGTTDFVNGTYEFNSAALDLLEGNDQHCQIRKTFTGGNLEIEAFLLIDVQAAILAP